MIQDGIYQWNRAQAFGPSTPMLAQFAHGELVRLEIGTNTALPSELIGHASSITREVEHRIADHARWGAQLEFSPALTVTLSNPVTGPVSVPLYPGGAA